MPGCITNQNYVATILQLMTHGTGLSDKNDQFITYSQSKSDRHYIITAKSHPIDAKHPPLANFPGNIS